MGLDGLGGIRGQQPPLQQHLQGREVHIIEPVVADYLRVYALGDGFGVVAVYLQLGAEGHMNPPFEAGHTGHDGLDIAALGLAETAGGLGLITLLRLHPITGVELIGD